ncbi:MAG: twin-arginine translocation signal domain-containing protein [Dehalococcoidia bacterium]|nr:twin-arginine translocation signal domain-containing protein [Dehalococcoidia bacterium]
MLDNSEKLSRREFLKAAGIVTGGVALGSLSLLTACQEGAGVTRVPSSTVTPLVPTTIPAGEVYVPPDTYPPLLSERYGCKAGVAADRWYTPDHIWVLEIEGDRVVLGITDKMQEITNNVTILRNMYKEGDIVRKGAIFAAIEAWKLNTDLITPVSGKILQLNHEIEAIPRMINTFPYSYGWLAVVQLTNSQELEELIGPGYYAYLQAVDIPLIVPPMRF